MKAATSEVNIFLELNMKTCEKYQKAVVLDSIKQSKMPWWKVVHFFISTNCYDVYTIIFSRLLTNTTTRKPLE